MRAVMLKTGRADWIQPADARAYACLARFKCGSDVGIAQHQSSLMKPYDFMASSRSLIISTNSFLRVAAFRISMSRL